VEIYIEVFRVLAAMIAAITISQGISRYKCATDYADYADCTDLKNINLNLWNPWFLVFERGAAEERLAAEGSAEGEYRQCQHQEQASKPDP
jgi:hypothetical protein